MEKKFRILRIIGTLWKVLAWIVLVGGILSALGILLAGALGSGGFILRLFEQETGVVPGALGIVSSIFGFIVALAFTIIYFLILYAVGELIYLMLAIEENTRKTMNAMEQAIRPEIEHSPSPPAPSP
jgi:hypothetical protein